MSYVGGETLRQIVRRMKRRVARPQSAEGSLEHKTRNGERRIIRGSIYDTNRGGLNLSEMNGLTAGRTTVEVNM